MVNQHLTPAKIMCFIRVLHSCFCISQMNFTDACFFHIQAKERAYRGEGDINSVIMPAK